MKTLFFVAVILLFLIGGMYQGAQNQKGINTAEVNCTAKHGVYVVGKNVNLCFKESAFVEGWL